MDRARNGELVMAVLVCWFERPDELNMKRGGEVLAVPYLGCHLTEVIGATCWLRSSRRSSLPSAASQIRIVRSQLPVTTMLPVRRKGAGRWLRMALTGPNSTYSAPALPSTAADLTIAPGLTPDVQLCTSRCRMGRYLARMKPAHGEMYKRAGEGAGSSNNTAPGTTGRNWTVLTGRVKVDPADRPPVPAEHRLDRCLQGGWQGPHESAIRVSVFSIIYRWLTRQRQDHTGTT